MIVTVDFISRVSAECLAAASDLALISIKDPLDMPPRLANFARMLHLEFRDVRTSDEVWAFEKSHANMIIEFVAALHEEANAYKCIVHCKAGISRSAAVAVYIAEATQCRFDRREQAGGANPLVLKLLCGSARDKRSP